MDYDRYILKATNGSQTFYYSVRSFYDPVHFKVATADKDNAQQIVGFRIKDVKNNPRFFAFLSDVYARWGKENTKVAFVSA